MSFAYAAKTGWSKNSWIVYGGTSPGGSKEVYNPLSTTHEYLEVGDAWNTYSIPAYAAPTGKGFCVGFVLDMGSGDRFVITGGGFAYEGSGLSAETHEYNPNTRTWASSGENLVGSGRTMGVGFALGGYGYYCGGHVLTGPNYFDQVEVQKLDPAGTAGSRWATTATPLGTALSGAMAAVVSGGDAFVFGGRYNTVVSGYGQGDQLDGGTAQTGVQSFDGSAWTTGLAALGAGRWGAGCAARGDKVYLIGGKGSGYLDDVDEYDTVGDSWTAKLPSSSIEGIFPARQYFSAGYSPGRDHILCTGGKISDSGIKSTTDHRVYDPVTNVFVMKAPLPTPPRFATVGAVM